MRSLVLAVFSTLILTPAASAAPLFAFEVDWPWSNKTTDRVLESVKVLGRTVHVYIPKAPLSPAPVVVDFHALSSSPLGEAYLTQLPKLAEDEGFVVVYPSGESLAIPAGPGFSWNAGACCPYATDGTDDIGLARAIPAAIEAALVSRNVTVDARRIYATGMSNGGFMTNRVACQASDLYAAFAPVAGLYAPGPSKVWKSDPYECKPGRKVPILHFHGKSDPIVKFAGTPELGFPAVQDYIEGWKTRNGLTGGGVVTYNRGAASCQSWGEDASNVTFCTVQGGGHSWPGSTAPGACPTTGPCACTRDIDATREIWRFLRRYTLP